MATDVGPPYDRIRLSPAELRAIADMEQALVDEQRAMTRLGARLQRRAATVGRVLYRVAPWVLPLAIVVTIVTSSRSVAAGAVCALGTAVLLMLTFWRVGLRVAERRTRSRRGDDRQRRP